MSVPELEVLHHSALVQRTIHSFFTSLCSNFTVLGLRAVFLNSKCRKRCLFYLFLFPVTTNWRGIGMGYQHTLFKTSTVNQ